MIPLLILIFLGILIFLVIPLICFRITFYVPKPKDGIHPEVPLPNNEVYGPYKDMMDGWTQEVLNMPHEHFTITSFDGLELHGNFYEYAPGAPIELMFHGYRGSALRDLSGGVARCFALKRSCLIVDQRCAGRSQGTVITFGIKEHQDCLKWVDFMVEHFGPDVKIILTGISMGASTVLMAGGLELPQNVRGILADCGFTSTTDIWKHVAKQARLAYPVYGGTAGKLAKKRLSMAVDADSCPQSLSRCRVPVLFVHGTDDHFVPVEMTYENYKACASPKRLFVVPGAEHGMSYLTDPQGYENAVQAFWTEFDSGIPS